MDFGHFHKLGFRARTFNNDFILTKTYPNSGVVVEVYQGLEPHHPIFKDLFDFTVPDACVIIYGGRLPLELERTLCNHFEFVKRRGDYLVAYSRFLEIDDLKLKSAIDFLELNLN